MRTFEANGSNCRVEVLATELKTGEPNQKIRISCDGASLLVDDLHDATVGIEIFDENTTSLVRIIAEWERGTAAGLTVFAVNPTSPRKAKIIFNHFEKCGGESLENGEVLLAHVGKRFVGSEILPAATNVYRWEGHQYEFQSSFTWKDSASWQDRYCVVMRPTGCPAMLDTKPVATDLK